MYMKTPHFSVPFHSHRDKIEQIAQSFMVSIHQVVSLLSLLINCNVRSLICTLHYKEPVSVLPRACKGKVIRAG